MPAVGVFEQGDAYNVLAGDFLKGSLAVAVARLMAGMFDSPGARVGWLDDSVSALTLSMAVAAVAAVSGHVWSIYMRLITGEWSGGRGVSIARPCGTYLASMSVRIWAGVLPSPVSRITSRVMSMQSVQVAAWLV